MAVRHLTGDTHPDHDTIATFRRTIFDLVDADSRVMRKNKRSRFEQGYNAQAVVDADGSQLI